MLSFLSPERRVLWATCTEGKIFLVIKFGKITHTEQKASCCHGAWGEPGRLSSLKESRLAVIPQCMGNSCLSVFLSVLFSFYAAILWVRGFIKLQDSRRKTAESMCWGNQCVDFLAWWQYFTVAGGNRLWGVREAGSRGRKWALLCVWWALFHWGKHGVPLSWLFFEVASPCRWFCAVKTLGFVVSFHMGLSYALETRPAIMLTYF